MITFLNIKERVKNLSEHVDKSFVDVCIIEAQDLDLKPIIGDALLIKIKAFNGVYTEKYKTLLNGGIYEHNGSNYEISGINTVLIYFAYARIIAGIDNKVSRAGFMQKQGDFSQHSELKERLQSSADAKNNAVNYLNECLMYLNRKQADFPEYTSFNLGVDTPNINKNKRVIFKAIGD